ncbi:MAG: tRNA lysidine(34) synthetase TilS [Kiritimatiellae bacterium]|nr:tRNA lysidine(34) synthetase TilS [Kiritimatiellia bacterium]
MRLPAIALDERWGLCFSGGADSTALLLKCVEAGFPFVALHFNHGFVDEAGDADEVFVRDLCAQLGVTLRVGHCTEAWAAGETKEVFARRHRLAFFAQCARELNLTGLLLAHHADDRAENVVLRLARGCGAEGLTSFRTEGVAPWDATLKVVRPLLDETHADQVAWLQARGQTWREDLSNSDLTIPRNAIRATLPTVLPHFSAGVNAAADVLAEENAFMATCATAAVVAQDERQVTVAAGTHAVLLRRILRGWLADLTREQTERLLGLEVGAVTMVSGNRVVRRVDETRWQWEVREVCVAPEAVRIEAPGQYRFGAWQITIGGVAAQWQLPLPLVVRSRRAGDRMRPRGMRGSRKIQDILTELRVPAAERDGYPLFCDEAGTILALPGFRSAALAEGVPTVGVSVQRVVGR